MCDVTYVTTMDMDIMSYHGHGLGQGHGDMNIDGRLRVMGRHGVPTPKTRILPKRTLERR